MSLVSLVHGGSLSPRAARALMDGRRAVYPRSPMSVPAAQPAQPSSGSSARRLPPSTMLPAGMHYVPHRGAWPQTVSCACACHGTGDTTGRDCDVDSCVDVVTY